MPDVVLVDVALHLLHLAFLRQDDHHGGVATVGQHDDGGVVVSVPVGVIVTRPHHHVHLNFGGSVHMEVRLVCQVTVEGFLPLSCMWQWREEDESNVDMSAHTVVIWF